MSEENNRLIVQKILTDQFGLSPHPDKVDFINHLANEINHLIQHDFQKLVNILYHVDVDESKLTGMLAKYVHDDAGYIIAQLIIDRQMQKMNARSESKKDENISEDEKW